MATTAAGSPAPPGRLGADDKVVVVDVVSHLDGDCETPAKSLDVAGQGGKLHRGRLPLDLGDVGLAVPPPFGYLALVQTGSAAQLAEAGDDLMLDFETTVGVVRERADLGVIAQGVSVTHSPSAPSIHSRGVRLSPKPFICPSDCHAVTRVTPFPATVDRRSQITDRRDVGHLVQGAEQSRLEGSVAHGVLSDPRKDLIEQPRAKGRQSLRARPRDDEQGAADLDEGLGVELGLVCGGRHLRVVVRAQDAGQGGQHVPASDVLVIRALCTYNRPYRGGYDGTEGSTTRGSPVPL